MKKLFCIALCFVMVLGCGCTAHSPAPREENLSVVATIFPYYDFARQIGGEHATVTMLLSPGGEVHGFEPTLQDLALIEQCDVFLYNGGEGDGWVESLLQGMDTSQKQIVRLMDCVELLAEGEEHHHHDHEHSHEEADEHIFTTPQNAKLIAKAVEDAMAEADSSHKEIYQTNGKNLQNQLCDLEQKYECLRGAEKTLVVADRFPFLYVTQEYDLTYIAAFSGCSANAEADVKTVYQLKTAMEEKGATKQVLCTEFSDQKLAATLANSVGGTVGIWHSCHNVTKEEWEQGVTYLQLMEQNLKVLKGVLL